MEDENKLRTIFKTIIIILIIIGVIVAGVIIYNNWQNKQNNERLLTYLKENNYNQNEVGIYYKTKKEGNTTTTDKAISNEYLFSRDTLDENDNYITMSVEYKKDKTIEVTYQVEGFDKNNNYGILFQKGTYKNKKFKCEIVTNIDFETKCDTMKKAAQNYEEEINDILNSQKINPDHIKFQTKKSSKI